MLAVIRKIGIFFLDKYRRVCTAETVDALLEVTDKEQVLPVFADTPEDHILQPVGVLILVQHDLLKLFGKFFSKLGRRSIGICDQPQCKCRKIIKIRNPCCLLGGSHPAGKLPDQ